MLCGEPPVVEGRERHAEMGQASEIRRSIRVAQHLRMILEAEVRSDAAELRRLRTLLQEGEEELLRGRAAMQEAMMDKDAKKTEPMQALLRRHNELMLQCDRWAVQQQEGWLSEQMQGDVPGMQRAGEKRKQEISLADPVELSAEKRKGLAVSSQPLEADHSECATM